MGPNPLVVNATLGQVETVRVERSESRAKGRTQIRLGEFAVTLVVTAVTLVLSSMVNSEASANAASTSVPRPSRTNGDPAQAGGAVPVSDALRRPLSARELRRIRNEAQTAVAAVAPLTTAVVTTSTVKAPTTTTPTTTTATTTTAVVTTTTTAVVTRSTVKAPTTTTATTTTATTTTATTTTATRAPTTTAPTTTTSPTTTSPSTTTTTSPSTTTTISPSTTTTSPSTTTTVPTTTTTTLLYRPDGGLVRQRTVADGAFVFNPPSRADRPKKRKREITRIARGVAPSSARSQTPELFFATFRIDTPKAQAPDSKPVNVAGYRSVWVVVYSKIEGERAAIAVIPERPRGSTPPTTTTTIKQKETTTTNFLIVVDDNTGEILIRSEYSSR
jgi:hypothetical protein